MSWVLLALVRLYRRLLSPVHHALVGPCCRFEPTCSAYAEEAVRAHGAAAWRVAGRCAGCCAATRFARAGFDPVPTGDSRGSK